MEEQTKNHDLTESLLNDGFGTEFATTQSPHLWKTNLRNFALEALKNQRLHKSRANILVAHGLAVFMKDGRCVLLLEVQDALHKMR